jgi:hypothetical protein
VTLQSSSTAALVPSSVAVAAGATSAGFTVTTTSVATSTTATITASYAGVSKSASLTVQPPSAPAPAPSSLALQPMKVYGGNAATGTVGLSAPAPAGGVVVNLVSANTTYARVPSTVTVPAGAQSASFAIATSRVSSYKTVSITASTAKGSVSKSLIVMAR